LEANGHHQKNKIGNVFIITLSSSTKLRPSSGMHCC